MINPSLIVFPMSLVISIYISSHTFSLSEKSQIKRKLFLPFRMVPEMDAQIAGGVWDANA